MEKITRTPSSPDNYPRTNSYREALPDIEAYGDLLFQEFLKNPKYIQTLNGSPDEPVEITPEEQEDIYTYVRYATKRLAAASALSPLNESTVPSSTSERSSVFRHIPLGSVGHDILHSMVSYVRSKGRSLIPEFARVATLSEQEVDRNAVEEEIMVAMWDGGAHNYLRTLFNSQGDLARAFLDRNLFAKSTDVEEYKSTVGDIEDLYQSNPIEFYMRAYEGMYLLDQLYYTEEKNHETLREVIQSIQESRDPEYVRLFTAFYESIHSTQPDPNIFLHEFLKNVEPLLQRLHANSENAEIPK